VTGCCKDGHEPKLQGIFSLAEDLLASQDVLCSMELLSRLFS